MMLFRIRNAMVSKKVSTRWPATSRSFRFAIFGIFHCLRNTSGHATKRGDSLGSRRRSFVTLLVSNENRRGGWEHGLMRKDWHLANHFSPFGLKRVYQSSPLPLFYLHHWPARLASNGILIAATTSPRYNSYRFRR